MLLYRDGRCLVCGRLLTLRAMHAHHIQSVGSGGEDCLENLIALCAPHHDAAHRGSVILDGKRYLLTPGVLRALIGGEADEEEREIARELRRRYAPDE